MQPRLHFAHTDLRSAPGGPVAYQAPCHLRAQGIGFRGRDLAAERITEAAGIQHELETYNELLGGPGELGATLLIEIDAPAVRAVKLREWLALPRHVYARLEDGTKVRPTFAPRQVGTERVSSVQYLKFSVGGRVPDALGIDLPAIAAETALPPEQRGALAADLAADR